MKQTSRMRVGVGLAALMVAGASLTGCGGDGDAAGDEMTLRVNVFGNFGYEDLYDQFEKDHPGVTIVETAEGDLGQYNTQLTQKIAAGSGAGDVVAIEEGQVVNFLQSADKFVNFQDHGSNDKQGPVAGLEVLAGHHLRRQDHDRPRHRRRRPGDVLPPRPVREGRPAHRPRRGRRAVADLGGLHRDRREVPAGHRRRRRALRRLGDQHLQLDPHAVAATTPTSTPTARSSIDSNPAVKAGLGHRRSSMVDAGISAKLKSFSNEWNAGLQERHLRHRRLPGLDDRLHQGAGRRGQRRQVGHRHGPRRRRQLGRLVPRRARRRASTRTWPSSWPSSSPARTGSSRPSRPSATCRRNPTLYDDPELQGRQERVLQRRSGRPDLRGRRRAA